MTALRFYIQPYFYKLIYIPITSPSYTKVKFTGTVTDYHVSYQESVNPYISYGMLLYTNSVPHSADTLVDLRAHKGNFNSTLNIKYTSEQTFHFVFAMIIYT